MVFFPLVLLFLYICLTFPSGNVSSASGMMNVEEKPKVEKRCYFIFDYNCRKSLTFFVISTPLETGMNTPPSHIIIYLIDS